MIQDVTRTELPKPGAAAADKVIIAVERLQDEKLKVELQELDEIARAFESVFLNMLMRSMRETVGKSKMFHGGRGEEIFTGLFDVEITGKASKQGMGLGIGKMIVERYAENVRVAEGSNGQSIDEKG